MVHQGYINHIGLVLDASSSMSSIKHETRKVADMQIKYLAERSQGTDQETRASVYKFSDGVECLFYDKDVLRLPSVTEHYHPRGMTALMDAVLQAISDLKQTATLYGDHAFLLYVLTDGQENASNARPYQLKSALDTLPENWTVAVFVPDITGVHEAKKLGFAPGNIAIWDTSEKGIKEVGETIKRTTDAYMTMRSQGVRSTTGLFQLDTVDLTPSVVQTDLLEVPYDAYVLYPVIYQCEISDFVARNTGTLYRRGNAFYELTKPEKVQASKQIMVQNRQTSKVYSGNMARTVLGLPNYEVKVAPVDHPMYTIFVQSLSVNRKLVPGTGVIVTQ